MSTAPQQSLSRPLSCLKQALRQCRAERAQHRLYATTAEIKYPSLQTRYPLPASGFRTSQTTKQNRSEEGLKRIPVIPPPRSTLKTCPDPIAKIYETQMSSLDPTGARTRLFSPANLERARVGDVLLVRLKTGDPFSGVVLNIRRRHSPIDTAILLRNHLTRVAVEMWFKIYSPNVEGIEIVQRRAKRARRARLYYMRQAKHDMGNVDGIVRQYMRTRMGGSAGDRGRDASGHKKKGNKKGRK